MTRVRPYALSLFWLLPVLWLLALAAALLNTGLFGPQTLTAYFSYTILASLAAIVTGLLLLRDRQSSSVLFPGPVLLFMALAMYIFLHGLLTRTLNLTHYYWAASAVFLWAVQAGAARRWRVELSAGTVREETIRAGSKQDTGSGADNGVVFLYKGITLLALLESLDVCGQWLRLIPSKNVLYTCTGTWENPNVTAMFLSMALYAALAGIKGSMNARLSVRRVIPYAIAGLILLAILLLRCRTAVIVAILFLAGHYWTRLGAFFHSRSFHAAEMPDKKAPEKGIRDKGALNKWLFVLFVIIAFGTVAGGLAFGVKRASTWGRIGIWENSLRLIARKPLAGQGIGYFEKEYNLFTASERLPGNDHVNMAYNDLLELGVEGGLGAVALWLAFLVVLWRDRRKNDYSVLPILALLAIQLTNFGFQALPVFVLFLLYTGAPPIPGRATNLSPAPVPHPAGSPGKFDIPKPVPKPVPKSSLRLAPGPVANHSTSPVADQDADLVADHRKHAAALGIAGVSAMLLIALVLFFHQSSLAKNFHTRNEISVHDSPEEAIADYAELEPSLHGFVSYHQHFGDAYLKMNQYRPALAQYIQGLGSSSNPDMMMRCGYCYQQLGQYDSSQYYYTLVENMMPYKFGPRMALLELYQQRGDVPMTRKEAEEILAMPVKVQSSEVAKIKAYARNAMGKIK